MCPALCDRGRGHRRIDEWLMGWLGLAWACAIEQRQNRCIVSRIPRLPESGAQNDVDVFIITEFIVVWPRHIRHRYYITCFFA